MNTEQTSENIFMHALMLMHVHKNLADVANAYVDRKNSRKQTFRHSPQNYS